MDASFPVQTAAGRMSVNSLPAPGSDFAVMSPPWRAAITT